MKLPVLEIRRATCLLRAVDPIHTKKFEHYDWGNDNVVLLFCKQSSSGQGVYLRRHFATTCISFSIFRHKLSWPTNGISDSDV